MKRDWKLSATCISAFKACPVRFFLGYVEGLRAVQDTEGQRVGKGWHSCQQVAALRINGPCLCMSLKALAEKGCPICEGRGLVPDEPKINRVTNWLNDRYATMPDGYDATAWEVERVILAYSMAGWLWCYQEDEIETVATEVRFELPLRNPASGRALPHVSRVGIIDRIIQRNGRLMNGEFKSTKKPIDLDSSYWSRLNLDSQVSMYDLAAKELQRDGTLAEYGGVLANGPLLAGTLYDVWRRPSIRPKKLTQADSKKFAEAGPVAEYCGATFEVSGACNIYIDGVEAEVEPGAKEGTFTIRETPEMFGARLLQEIYKDPGKYFARKEIARTDDELKDFEWQMYNIYQAMRSMNRHNRWWTDESQCEATFRCPYTSICYNHIDVTDGETPPGFRRIFDVHSSVTESE